MAMPQFYSLHIPSRESNGHGILCITVLPIDFYSLSHCHYQVYQTSK